MYIINAVASAIQFDASSQYDDSVQYDVSIQFDDSIQFDVSVRSQRIYLMPRSSLRQQRRGLSRSELNRCIELNRLMNWIVELN